MTWIHHIAWTFIGQLVTMVAMSTPITDSVPDIPALEKLRSGAPTISVAEAGKYLGISPSYAYMMVKNGRLPVIQLGSHRVRVPTKALLKMLEGE